MITDIIPYVYSYDNIRAVLGTPDDELPDETLALPTFADTLSAALNSHGGVYSPETTYQTLQEIFDRPLQSDDYMLPAIRNYSVYVVAQAVARGGLSLLAVKTKSDGKSSITRFSDQSTYSDVMVSVDAGVRKWLKHIYRLLGTSVPDAGPLMRAVPPAVDVVTGLETS